MTIGEEVLIHGYIDEIRKDIVIIRNEGGYFGTVSEEIRSSSEIPNTCEDAISRQAAIRAIEALQRPIMREESNYYQFKFSGMSEALGAVENLPSVTPQQRTGRWIEVIDESDSLGNKTWHHECSICGSDKSGWGTYKHCPDCGTKMEVEE
jgi:hypothetical protein